MYPNSSSPRASRSQRQRTLSISGEFFPLLLFSELALGLPLNTFELATFPVDPLAGFCLLSDHHLPYLGDPFSSQFEAIFLRFLLPFNPDNFCFISRPQNVKSPLFSVFFTHGVLFPRETSEASRTPPPSLNPHLFLV